MAEPETPPLRQISTARDEMAAAFAHHNRVLEQVIANAAKIAQARRALYLALKDAGFAEDQALELCRFSTL